MQTIEKILYFDSEKIFLPNYHKNVSSFFGSSRYNFNPVTFNLEYSKNNKIKNILGEKKIDYNFKMFSINKKEVKNRIIALSNLSVSRNNLYFWTVSFPLYFPDKSALSVLNNVFTSLRSGKNWFQYVWVAERQKNGTIHFHIVVNKFFNVRIVNYKFACAIENEIEKNSLSYCNFEKKKYNGFDVKKIFNRKGVTGYITKYISKNNESFPVRCWSCDRITGSLFTHGSEYQDAFEINENSLQKRANGDIHSWSNIHGKYFFFKGQNNSDNYKFMNFLNEKIYMRMYAERWSLGFEFETFEKSQINKAKEIEKIKFLKLF